MTEEEEYPDFFEHSPIYTLPKLKLNDLVNKNVYEINNFVSKDFDITATICEQEDQDYLN